MSDESLDGRLLPSELLDAWEVPAPAPDLVDRILAREASTRAASPSQAPPHLALAEPTRVTAPRPVSAAHPPVRPIGNTLLMAVLATAALLSAFFMGRESVTTQSPSVPSTAPIEAVAATVPPVPQPSALEEPSPVPAQPQIDPQPDRPAPDEPEQPTPTTKDAPARRHESAPSKRPATAVPASKPSMQQKIGAALKRAGVFKCRGKIPGMKLDLRLVIASSGSIISARAKGSKNGKFISCVEHRARKGTVLGGPRKLSVARHTIRF